MIGESGTIKIDFETLAYTFMFADEGTSGRAKTDVSSFWNITFQEKPMGSSDTLKKIPEPLTILGSGVVLGFGAYFKKTYSKKEKKAKGKA